MNKKPNIVLILNDDMGFSDLSCYGGDVETPHLDRLAENGLRFTQFYNTARCCPSRASLLSGLHPHQAGVGDMVGSYPEIDGYEGTLKKTCVTIAELLKLDGYAAYMAGKWHVAKRAESDQFSWPLQRGFDRFYGTIDGAGNYFFPHTLKRGNEDITEEGRIDPDYYYTDAISDNAVAMIRDHCEQNPDQPFFQYVAYTAPHWPLHAKEADIAKYKGRFAEGWDELRQERFERLKALGIIAEDWELSSRDPGVESWEETEHKEWQQRRMEVYCAQIDCMDQGIGRIVDEIERQGQLDNTLIIFLADNGGCHEDVTHFEFIRRTSGFTSDGKPVRFGNFPDLMPGGEDGYCSYCTEWANVSNTPFRMYKCWTNEGGISTPLIVHWPEGIKAAGELRHEPYQLPDIMAAIIDITGAKYPKEYDGCKVTPAEGESFYPVFNNPEHKRRNLLFWEHEGNAAVRDGKWKLVLNHSGRVSGVQGHPKPEGRGKWELYDLSTDRTEIHNLAEEKPEIVSRLLSEYEKWAERCGVLSIETLREMMKEKRKTQE